MVEFGATLAKEHGFKNLEYRLGDIEDPPIATRTPSISRSSARRCITRAILARAIAAAHRILKKNGRIVVLDLLAHHFEQARELYADLWLGFSEVRLHQLLKEAGFNGIEVSVVARDVESPQLQTLLATGTK